MTVWEQLINSEAEALFSIIRKEQEERWSHIIRAGEQLKREAGGGISKAPPEQFT